MKYTILVLSLLVSFSNTFIVEARSGCCSHHGGVRSDGCGCNDGSSLSATCAPYYSCTTETVYIAPKVVTPPVVQKKVITPTKPTFTRILKKGMTGPDVKQLQEALKKLGYLPNSHTVSTSFGTVTQNAVIKFQKDNKIKPAAGTFDVSTQTKLLSLIK